ncbi:MAG: hypothetical protein DHS20C16_12680 [Phycisphaerae bacterium]|nr:MAG: hypothetical protein DHS20C16_12680 [Phycisphaerae bacterium]
MDSAFAYRLIAGSATLAGAATVAALWPAGVLAAVGTTVGYGIGTSFLHRCSDDLTKKLASSPAYAKDYLRNEDLRRLVGETIAAKLKDLSSDDAFDKPTRDRLEVLALHAEEAWLAIADHATPQRMNEDVVTRLFAMSPENFANATALDADAWAGFLKFLDGRIAEASTGKKIKRMVTPGGRAVGTSKLPEAVRLHIGAKLKTEFPHALHINAKRAFENNDPAYAALQLRLMRDLMTDVRDILATVSGTSQRIEDLFVGQERIESKLTDLAGTIKRLAPTVKKSIPVNCNFDPQAILDEINNAHAEVMAQLKVIGEGVAFLVDQHKIYGVRPTPPANNNFDLANITDNVTTLKGRDGVIADLHAALSDPDDSRMVVIRAGTGQGKSAVARRYVFGHADDRPHRYWLHAQTGALDTSAAELLKRIDPNNAAREPADVRAAILEYVSRVGGLLVLDNVDHSDVINQWRPIGEARALATTIKCEISPANGREFKLPVLGEEAADDILWLYRGTEPRPKITRATSSFGDPTPGERTDALAELARHVEFNALGLNYLAACLKRTRFADPADLLTAIKNVGLSDSNHPVNKVKAALAGPDYHATKDTPAMAIVDAYELLVDEVMGKPAEPVLLAAAHLSPDTIPLGLLAVGANLDDDATADAIDALHDDGILEWDGTHASIHRFTQDIARARGAAYTDNRNEEIVSRLLTALTALFDDAEFYESHATRIAALPHAESVLEHAPSALVGRASRLRAVMANHLGMIGQLTSATNHIEAAISWSEAQTPRDEQSLTVRYASRATIRQLRGDLVGAEDDINKRIEWRVGQTPHDERSLAIEYSLRASIRQQRGDVTGAEDDIEKSIEWGEAQSPRNERILAIDYATRARIRQDRGDMAGAEVDIQKSIEWGEAQTPRNERSLAIDYAMRATIRLLRGNLAGAEEDIKKSIEWEEAQPLPNQRELGIRYALRANIRQPRGDLAGAENDIQKSIAWGETQTPFDKRSLAIWYGFRARILRAQGSKARNDGSLGQADDLFDKSKADIAKAIEWFEENLPGDTRTIGLMREDQARIERAARGE